MDRNEMLQDIQEIEFVLLELQLYLDTHPEDIEALNLFNAFSGELQKLKLLYDLIYGPLLGFGFSQSKDEWKWVNDPWPWQLEKRCK
ncbi:spore coat protein CotJB [Halobacillus massiliensis]|uniref:spore coat protein CotJB n=1 Tax=Halobacillus massiliensis TaxID=1926286 RepID=UPI002481FD8C|nr:spore coat protein CotJB [Halobacillus massiliensis]